MADAASATGTNPTNLSGSVLSQVLQTTCKESRQQQPWVELVKGINKSSSDTDDDVQEESPSGSSDEESSLSLAQPNPVAAAAPPEKKKRKG